MSSAELIQQSNQKNGSTSSLQTHFDRKVLSSIKVAQQQNIAKQSVKQIYCSEYGCSHPERSQNWSRHRSATYDETPPAHRHDEYKERQSLHVPPFDLSPFPSAAEIINGGDVSEAKVSQSADTQSRTTSPALVCRSTQVTSGSKSVLSAQLIEPACASASDSLNETKDATILHRRNRISIVEFDSTSIPQPPVNNGRVAMNKQNQVKRDRIDRCRLNTLKSVQHLHELDSFRRAGRDFQTSEDCAPGDVHKLLHLFILRRPLLWRAFVSTFIFQRLTELKRMLSSSACKHVIISDGRASSICHALLACGLHGHFDGVMDTRGRIYLPRSSFVVDPKMAYGYGEPDALAAAFSKVVSRGQHNSVGCKKDAFIALQMRKKWASVFPPEWASEEGRVVYIDDDPVSLDALPPSVTVVKLPPEGEGVVSPQGREAMARAGVDLATLGPEDVVVWDFDCTLSSAHYYKTMHMRTTTEPGVVMTDNEMKWGVMLANWWQYKYTKVLDSLSGGYTVILSPDDPRRKRTDRQQQPHHQQQQQQPHHQQQQQQQEVTFPPPPPPPYSPPAFPPSWDSPAPSPLPPSPHVSNADNPGRHSPCKPRRMGFPPIAYLTPNGPITPPAVVSNLLPSPRASWRRNAAQSRLHHILDDIDTDIASALDLEDDAEPVSQDTDDSRVNHRRSKIMIIGVEDDKNKPEGALSSSDLPPASTNPFAAPTSLPGMQHKKLIRPKSMEACNLCPLPTNVDRPRACSFDAPRPDPPRVLTRAHSDKMLQVNRANKSNGSGSRPATPCSKYASAVMTANFEFRRSCGRDDAHKLLHLFILYKPLLWRAFVSTFIFQRLAELKRMLSSSVCKHVIISCGFAPQICSALLACDLQGSFEAVLDAGFNCYRPVPGFKHPEGVISAPAYGNTKTFSRAWRFCPFAFPKQQEAFRKDEVISKQIQQDWVGMLPSPPLLADKQKRKRRVVYIDDDPHTDKLPPSVTVVKLPPEGEGVVSPQGREAMARAGVDLATLGPEDVVVWDFDCTLSSIHMWKTLNMRRTSEPGFFPTNYEQIWGSRLIRWWKEQTSRAHDVLSTKVRGKIEVKAPSPSSNVVVFQDDEYSFTHEI